MQPDGDFAYSDPKAHRTDDPLNIQVKEGMNPLWVCDGCGYSKIHTAGGVCYRCEQGMPPPDLSFIREMSRTGQSIQKTLEALTGTGSTGDSAFPP